MTPTAPIVHIYYSNMAHESRLLRAAKAAVEEGLASEAIGIGYQEGAFADEEVMADRVTFRRIRPPKWSSGGGKIARLMRWPLWTLRAARETARARPSVVQAHSLAAMPAGILAARIIGKAKLVYDAHELESERTGWSNGLKRIARVGERRFVRMADAVIVVSATIADWYAEHYRIAKPYLIRNMPETPQENGTRVDGIRSRLGLAETDMIFVYLGKLTHGRGIPILVEAFQRCPPDRHLVLLGDGSMETWLHGVAAANPNIHVLSPVPSAEVIGFIASADVGLSLGEDVSLSYRYSLPNKLFESRHAGLPVIVANMLEMANFVRTHGGGWIVDQNVADVENLVRTIDKAEVARVCAAARPIPRWEDDRALYINIIKDLTRS
ncbi:Glycosyltransferase involved in cell wall bisynthesis [Sphingopyxis sp. YR583]|uniref:glycosyltransferase n=1 Tax=Sphingopyxis sp. YR583 TaxID=1881047 RepID=UPI0008A7F978|nr:glycosyltransferase [Sphingopyxis sp. YR583]SEH18288.1 Glycosyltransferase involved in cell wall bisynthesis [Sphingopyxis sp. YR583]